jgi:hypothetical protein
MQAETLALRLIQRNRRVSDAAKAAQELFKQQRRNEEAYKKGTSSGRAAEHPTRNIRFREIQLTGQEIYDNSGGNDASRDSRASQDSGSESDIAPGDAIFILWKNKIWYPATCISKTHRIVEFRWLEPGDYPSTGSANLDKVRRRIVGSFEIAVGSLIYVKWSEDGKWYRAKFLSKHANTVQFEWESCGDFEPTGTVESSHVRIMIDESQPIKLSPVFLPCEDSVRRYNKDCSTSYRQETSLSAPMR